MEINIYDEINKGQYSKEALKIFDEFITLEPKDITLKNILYMKEYSKGFSGKLASLDNFKLFEITEYLLKTK